LAMLETKARMQARPDISFLLGHFGTGGVERVTCLLANGFEERGLGAQIYAAHAEGPARALLNPGVQVVSAEVEGDSRRAKLKQSIPHIARYLRRVRPRIFFSPGNHAHIAAGLAHKLARRKDVALVVKITNPIPKASLGTIQRALSRSYYKWLLRRADLILVLSPSGVAQVQRVAGDRAAAKVRFVHNPYIPLDRPAARAGAGRQRTPSPRGRPAAGAEELSAAARRPVAAPGGSVAAGAARRGARGRDAEGAGARAWHRGARGLPGLRARSRALLCGRLVPRHLIQVGGPAGSGAGGDGRRLPGGDDRLLAGPHRDRQVDRLRQGGAGGSRCLGSGDRRYGCPARRSAACRRRFSLMALRTA
jgi:hypothetical protein